MRHKNSLMVTTVVGVTLLFYSIGNSQTLTYTIVGTGQTNSYDNSGVISLPISGQLFYGQNANHPGNTPSYTNNSNGTITDNVTGLMWEKTSDKNGDGVINYYDKKTYADALADASFCTTGGYNDWRLPTIKEIYSLVMSYGAEPNPTATSQGAAVPYIDTNFFDFGYGDLNSSLHGATLNERLIDAQYATSTICLCVGWCEIENPKVPRWVDYNYAIKSAVVKFFKPLRWLACRQTCQSVSHYSGSIN